MIIVMLQTLEASAVEDEASIRDIIAHSEQMVTRKENVYFILNKDYEI